MDMKMDVMIWVQLGGSGWVGQQSSKEAADYCVCSRGMRTEACKSSRQSISPNFIWLMVVSQSSSAAIGMQGRSGPAKPMKLSKQTLNSVCSCPLLMQMVQLRRIWVRHLVGSPLAVGCCSMRKELQGFLVVLGQNIQKLQSGWVQSSSLTSATQLQSQPYQASYMVDLCIFVTVLNVLHVLLS